MASKCPNCGRVLKWYDVKAECKDCGVSIPNFNWEARLEEDAEKAAVKSASFNRTMSMFKYSVWGTKLRIARIILSFIPIVGYIVPWFAFKSEGESLGIDVIGLFTDGKSLIDFFKSFFGNMSLYFTNMGYEGMSGPVTYISLGVLFMVLCLLFAVIAFFMILIRNKNPKSKTMVIFDCLSISSSVVSLVMFTLGAKACAAYPAFTLGEMSFYNASGSVQWGYFVALGLLSVALVANILVMKSPAKTHDELEEERLKKKAEKEEKERENELRKEEERIEAERKAAEEQAKIVEEARAKLEADKKKKEKK